MNTLSLPMMSEKLPTPLFEVFLEYCELAIRPSLSFSETERIAEILEQAQVDEMLNLLIDEADLYIAKRFSWLSAEAADSYNNQIAKLEEYAEIFCSEDSPQTSQELRQQAYFVTGKIRN